MAVAFTGAALVVVALGGCGAGSPGPYGSDDGYYPADSSQSGGDDWQMGADGTGYPVTCADGSVSWSGGRQGACSWRRTLNRRSRPAERTRKPVATPS